MYRNAISKIGAIVALSVNYACAFVITFFWKWPDPESALGILVLIFLISSFLFGCMNADLTRSLVYTLISAGLGTLLATALIISPNVIIGENIELLDASLTVAISSISRFLLVSITFLFIGAMVGSLVGDAISK